MNELITALASAAGAAAVIIPVWRTIRHSPSRSVTDQVTIASAAEGVVKVYVEALNRHTDELAAMRAELGDAERRIDILEANLHMTETSLAIFKHGVGVLIAQLQRLGHTPDWRPEQGA